MDHLGRSGSCICNCQLLHQVLDGFLISQVFIHCSCSGPLIAPHRARPGIGGGAGKRDSLLMETWWIISQVPFSWQGQVKRVGLVQGTLCWPVEVGRRPH